MRTELDLVEHTGTVPCGEDALTGQVRQIHLALSAVLVAQPNPMAHKGPNVNRTDHTQVLPHHEQRVHLFT